MSTENFDMTQAPSLRDFATQAIRNYYQLHTGHIPLYRVHHLIMSEVEQPLIEETLDFVEGNVEKAANILGISKYKILKKIETYGIG